MHTLEFSLDGDGGNEKSGRARGGKDNCRLNWVVFR